MSMGRTREKQASLWVAAPSLPRSPGHRFYEKLNELLRENGFDRAMEAACAKYFEADGTAGRPSIPPGLYFRMLLVGYFEGLESERGLEWRCSDSLSLREFLGLLPGEMVPDHSTLSKMRKRLGGEVFEAMFAFVLGIVNRSGLLQGKVMGVDSTYLRADASMKGIVRRETGEVYADYIKRLAREEGIENPTVEDARRLDRKRKGKKTSNSDWKSRTDEDARITKLKDGRTRLAYKTEHVVDMNSGAVVAAEVYSADEADSDDDPPPEGGNSDAEPERTVIEVVADKGYHKAELLLSLKDSGYRTYVPERIQPVRRWVDKGWDMQQAFYGNRNRVRRPKGRALQRKRGELIERTFAHACETGGMRRVRVRGRENVRKRYLAHVAALNLGLVLRQMLGAGTPRALAAARKGSALAILVIWAAMVALVRGMPRRLARFSPAAWRGMCSGELQDVGVAIGGA
jgi:transposase